MNSKNIKKHLNNVLRNWTDSIEDEDVKKIVKENTIITGGALVSLLTGEKVHDYDVYMRTKQACEAVAHYYVQKWNAEHEGERYASVKVDDKTGKVSVFIRSDGVAGESPDEVDESVIPEETEEKPEEEKDGKKYRPVFLTANAITLSNKIQIVTRFYGEVEEIHNNYDFAHCTCAWSSWDNNVSLPTKALECIINKELYYIGSQYPLCSIIRTRKYIERGYHINAGQYVKMCMQLNGLDLNDIETLEDQLTGVDTTYFKMMITALRKKAEESGEQKADSTYVIELINRMF
jgi:hypothetical protein